MINYMLLQFISHWIQIIFIIWFLLYQNKIEIHKKLNIYYLVQFLWYSYLLYVFINLCLGVRFSIDFLLFNLLTHGLPLYYFNKINYQPNQYSLVIFVVVFMMYLIYIRSINKTMIEIYIIDEQITSF